MNPVRPEHRRAMLLSSRFSSVDFLDRRSSSFIAVMNVQQLLAQCTILVWSFSDEFEKQSRCIIKIGVVALDLILLSVACVLPPVLLFVSVLDCLMSGFSFLIFFFVLYVCLHCLYSWFYLRYVNVGMNCAFAYNTNSEIRKWTKTTLKYFNMIIEFRSWINFTKITTY